MISQIWFENSWIWPVKGCLNLECETCTISIIDFDVEVSDSIEVVWVNWNMFVNSIGNCDGFNLNSWELWNIVCLLLILICESETCFDWNIK